MRFFDNSVVAYRFRPPCMYNDMLLHGAISRCGIFGTELQGTSPTAVSSLQSFRPPTSPFGLPSQTEYSTVSSLHIWHLLAFSVVGPTVWNSLPYSLRGPAVKSERFRPNLKMHLFRDMSALEVSCTVSRNRSTHG